MRLTSSVRAIIRSYDDAMKDMRDMCAVMMRYGIGPAEYQPVDAQLFSVSSTQDHYSFRPFALTIGMDRRYLAEASEKRLNPRFAVNRHKHKHPIRRMLNAVIDPQVIQHRRNYRKTHKALASPEQIVYGSRDALKRILEAIRKKDLSPLSPLLLDDSILSEIATKSKLSSLTKRQMSCLDVSEYDFIGMDGIVDRWNKIDLPEDDPSGLLSSLKIVQHEKLNKPILSYTVDMMACLRKKVLVSKMGGLPPPNEAFLKSAPKAYGLPFMRYMYATVEFAHVGTDTKGKFSEEPFLLDFHVHSI